MKSILITGHLGLIGRHLAKALTEVGYKIEPFDVSDETGDILDASAIARAVSCCDGIVHLAAVSRVVWAERDPELCWATNANSADHLINAAMKCPRRPWIVAASSREVYGQARTLPASEESPLSPVNIYGRSKVAMEEAILRAQSIGLVAAVIRLSNVYGCPLDHEDRAIPAFCRAAIDGKPLRVDGQDTLFDFTHVSDVVRGMVLLIEKLDCTRVSAPTLQFVTGKGTSLHDAARQAINSAHSTSNIGFGPARTYDVAKFVGDPYRAKKVLGWEPRIDIASGMTDLILSLRKLHNTSKPH